MVLSVFSLLALLPSGLQALRPQPTRDWILWLCLAIGVAGPLAHVAVTNLEGWQTGFSATLWATVAATMAMFVGVSVVTRQGWRLAPLVSAFLAAFGLLALLWQGVPGPPLAATPDEMRWLAIHIGTALATYSLVTLAAVAALATYLQERAIKRKRLTRLNRLLPSLIDCERLVVTLLGGGEGILAAGLVTGMALSYRETGTLLELSHKNVLTLVAFIVIALVLFGYLRGGVRGRRAARWVLVAYLVLALGYPGVKFVTDIVIGTQ